MSHYFLDILYENLAINKYMECSISVSHRTV